MSAVVQIHSNSDHILVDQNALQAAAQQSISMSNHLLGNPIYRPADPGECNGILGLRIYSPLIFESYCLVIHGGNVNNATLFNISHFKLSIFNKVNNIYTPVSGAFLQSRLWGETILDVNVTESDTKGQYNFSFEPRDPGHHSLQIRLSWFDERLKWDNIAAGRNTFIIPNTSLTQQYVDSIIYSKRIKILMNSHIDSRLYRDNNKTRCNGGTDNGRWVKIYQHHCPKWACYQPNGAVDPVVLSRLTDVFGFNKDYVWVPWDCSMQLFSSTEITQCFARKEIKSVAFTGDSLAREHSHNLIGFMNQDIKLPKVKKGSLTTTLPNGVKVHFSNYGKSVFEIASGMSMNNVLFFFNNPALKIMNQGEAANKLGGHDAYDDAVGYLRYNNNYTHKNYSFIGNFAATYFIHPRVQRTDIRSPKAYYVPHTNISPYRQDKYLESAEQWFNPEHNCKVLNGLRSTNSRWESSYDGIHYSLGMDENVKNCTEKDLWLDAGQDLCGVLNIVLEFNKCINDTMYYCAKNTYEQYGLMQFAGGVSNMLTMIWINMVC